MTRFEIDLKTTNAAFDPPDPEISRILRDIADKLEAGNLNGGTIMDINGNPVGGWFTDHDN